MRRPPPEAAPAAAVPQGEPIAAGMRRSGIDRRTLLRWSAYMAGVLALPAGLYATRIADAMETQPRLPVLWLNGQDCTGDIEGLLRADNPTPSQLILDQLSLDYAELLMAGSGKSAHAALTDAMAKYQGRYVVVVEGSIPTADDGAFCCVGGQSFAEIVRQAAAGALAVIAAGSCAADGGLPGAKGGITGAASVKTVLGDSTTKIISFPGCPMNIENLTATLVQYLTLGQWPETDANGLPLFAYGARIHPNCERLPFLRAGKVALEWGDAGHQAGWCLRYVGCQGPRTQGNCATVKFNSKTSWPVAAGSPCIGCTRVGFWDQLDPVFAWLPGQAPPPPPTSPTATPSTTPSTAAPTEPPATPTAAPTPEPTPTPAMAGSR